MGITITQKSIIKKKVILLLVSLILTGLMMRILSPENKLDSRPFYTFYEGVNYLVALSETQKTNYFYAELFDLWFLVNYSWIFFLGMDKFFPQQKKRWLAIIPGVLDLCETSLIIFYLSTGKIVIFHQLLPTFSSLKWLLVSLLILYLGKKLFWRRAYR